MAINMSELAQKMLEWEEVQTKADALALEIGEAVLELGKTQTVGNVRATYSAGRKRYDYELAAKSHVPVDFIQRYMKPTFDFKQACADYGVEDIPFTQSEPSVGIRLLS